MLRSVKVLMVIAVMAAVFSLTAFAQAPHTLMYQGKLTDENMVPITVATAVTFTIWDLQDTETGTALWSEELVVSPDTYGVFTVELGADTPFPLSLFNGSVRFLSMTVATEELLPRQPITSVPYAMSSVGFANDYLSNVALPTSTGAIHSLSIRVPGPGFVALELTGMQYHYKDASESGYSYISIDSTGGYMDYWSYDYFPTQYAWPAGYYYGTISLSRVFATDTAGLYTFYVNSYRSSLVTSAYATCLNFKGIYYRNHVGAVTPLPGSVLGGATAAPPISPGETARREQGMDQ